MVMLFITYTTDTLESLAPELDISQKCLEFNILGIFWGENFTFRSDIPPYVLDTIVNYAMISPVHGKENIVDLVVKFTDSCLCSTSIITATSDITSVVVSDKTEISVNPLISQ